MSNLKSKNWGCVLYDINNINTLIQRCKKYNIMAAISPLHNNDVYEDVVYDNDGNIIHYKGEFKKEHYHTLHIFDTPKSINQMMYIYNDLIESQNKLELIYDRQLAYEYLWHQNNFEKYQYNKKDTILINCKDTDFYDSSIQLKQILDIIQLNNIINIFQLYNYFEHSREKINIYKVIKCNAYLINIALNENRRIYETYTYIK